MLRADQQCRRKRDKAVSSRGSGTANSASWSPPLTSTPGLKGNPRRRVPGSRPGRPRCDQETEGQRTGQHHGHPAAPERCLPSPRVESRCRLTATVTAAANGKPQRPATTQHTRTIRGNWGYVRPEKRTVVRQRSSIEHLAYALRACPRDVPEPPSTANDRHQQQLVNMRPAQALNLRPTHGNTLVIRRSLGDDEDQGAAVPRRASSERQRAGGCEHVHLVERNVLEIAAAVGVAGQDRRSGNGAGAAAGRIGELPGAADDFPGGWIVAVATQLSGLTETEKSRFVLTRCMLPLAKTRSSRLTLSGSVGRLGTSTIRPTPVNTPLATITLLMTVRVPETPEVTMVPRIVSLPLVAAAAGMTVAAEIASAMPVASSAPVTCRFMFPPQFAESARVSLPWWPVVTPHGVTSGVR